MKDLLEILEGNPYPGRGIVVGKTAAGQPCIYYFIMGRSVNSRNRVFTLTEDGIQTEAHDPSAMVDPSLIIYHPVRETPEAIIVTNGDQTDTIWQMNDFRAALATREYEPDEPNFTPRISAIRYAAGNFELAILKHQEGRCVREFFAYEDCNPGTGYFLSTYQGDGSPLPTFAGEPLYVSMPEADDVWAALNQDNKVSLYAKVGDAVSIYNKNLGD